MSQAQKQTLGFETEVDQLLHLMTHSLYSNKEIFLRELISNASDAIDKLRFQSLSDAALLENDSDFKIKIDFDRDQHTLTITDNGCGMNREDIIANLGTIAKSGTREFREMLTKSKDNQNSTSNLIGQFGVGFYSAFIVADKVTVVSRKAGLTKEHGVRWESTGSGGYTIENIDRIERGTEVTLHLKADEHEFLDDWRLRSIITKYSDHIALPILMKKMATDEKDKKIEWEIVNQAKALWTRPKHEIKETDYQELYKHLSHDFENPLLWSHNKVEGKLEYISLLYIPAHAPFDLWHREYQRGLKLYQNRVFIMDKVEQFLPMYLRFIRGVIDCADLPLNISREILQSNSLVTNIRAALTKRVLSMLENLARDDHEKYLKFWQEFGKVLKEGIAEDRENKDEIAKLLRFSSTNSDAQTVTLMDYVARMKGEQNKIYYLTADNFNAAKNSPHLEIFRKKGIEVLLLSDRIDEWVVTHLTEFGGKQLQSIAKGDLALDEIESKEERAYLEKTKTDFDSVIKHIKTVLGDQIKDARVTKRLTNSPACIVADDEDMNINLRRILASAGQTVPVSKPIFEVNPEHAIIKLLRDEQDDDRFAEWVNVLFDQAMLAENGRLDNSAEFVTRLNNLLTKLAK